MKQKKNPLIIIIFFPIAKLHISRGTVSAFIRQKAYFFLSNTRKRR